MRITLSAAITSDGYLDDNTPRRLMISTPEDWAAVLALAGAYGVLLPRDEFQLIFPVPLVLKARTLVAVLFALNVIELLFVVSQTAYLAHLFGIAGGIGAGLWLRRRTPHTPIFS